jgi:hypothetical protein
MLSLANNVEDKARLSIQYFIFIILNFVESYTMKKIAGT